MLDDIRLSYEACADLMIPGWRTENKNTLINKCIEVEDNKELYNAYVSAIIVRYWNLISNYYYQNQLSVTPEDCYGWLLDSIMCALECKQWKNPENKIYNDPAGPDKVVNRCMASARLMFYQSSNCAKRRVNYQTYSSDKMQEDKGDAAFPPMEDEDLNRAVDGSDELILRAFNRKDYFSCAVIDSIAHEKTYDVIKENGKTFTQFNPRKLARILRKCDETYCNTFSRRYKVDVSDMKEQVCKIKKFSSEKMYRWIERTLRKLREDSDVREMLG